ncbi:MAG: hypothetical protein WBA74_18450, partial [Cyclobacteriaceae bacterium]
MMRYLLLVVFLCSCAASNDEKLQKESMETLDLAIRISEHVNDKIQQIAAHAKGLEQPLKLALQDSVQVLTQDLAYWESTIVEVPGYERHIHAGHHHDHHHLSASGLTPEM